MAQKPHLTLMPLSLWSVRVDHQSDSPEGNITEARGTALPLDWRAAADPGAPTGGGSHPLAPGSWLPGPEGRVEGESSAAPPSAPALPALASSSQGRRSKSQARSPRELPPRDAMGTAGDLSLCHGAPSQRFPSLPHRFWREPGAAARDEGAGPSHLAV
ncbi:hypothetical protein P7K49_030319 [Saguinus oedipus]|uniref:Uncharacterized protein n=1 Tax=Saguinus oedipus TaxID=9490 RepID=A0ABQ9U2Q4_SAGOE|nr:hypothetical protein P7K49_030319 [Saguinus oedipus]